jgi:hypothetical protein
VYEIPQFGNNISRTIFGNWQISGILRIQSGSWFRVSQGTDSVTLTGSALSDLPDQVLPDVYSQDQGVFPKFWLNPAAFAPARTTGKNPYQPDQIWGNSAQYEGPGRIVVDAGLSRTFQVREGQSVQFRIEAFNAPNHLNPGNPDTNMRGSYFGMIRTAGDPRIMQLALKYVF